MARRCTYCNATIPSLSGDKRTRREHCESDAGEAGARPDHSIIRRRDRGIAVLQQAPVSGGKDIQGWRDSPTPGKFGS